MPTSLRSMTATSGDAKPDIAAILTPERRRLVVGLTVAVSSITLVTFVLTVLPTHLGLSSIYLLYLTCVVLVALFGGPWVALSSAVIASLTINWFFTPPKHTLVIASSENVLGLIVFTLVAAVVSVLVNREARSRAEADRRRTESVSLEKVNELRTAILAAVSHDLRTPLASIKASVSSLREEDVSWSNQESSEFLATIEDDTDRLTAVVGNLLDMSRIQTGSLVLKLERLGLDEVVPRAVAPFAEHEVMLDVPESLPRVLVDGALLERAVTNIVSNARQWNAANSPVIIFAGTKGTRVELRVIDHGPGVPAEDRLRMFQPFQRLGNRPGSEGIGLGLAVALGFVEAVGGTITARDTPGGGLTVVLSFEAVS